MRKEIDSCWRDCGDPAIIYHKREAQWRSTEIPKNEGEGWSGLPLGVKSETTFQQGTVELKAGDRVALYTDGMLEAMNEKGDAFGEERLIDALNETGNMTLPETKRHVLERLTRFAGGQLDHDDVTFMVIDFKPLET